MAPPTPTSIMLVNREYFDYLAPDPSVITLDVLEHGLQAPRFNNQTLRTITIAEHSLRVRRIAVEIGSRLPVHPDNVARWSLFHDAHEALTPWGDCLRPGKAPEMRAIEDHIDNAIIASIARAERRDGIETLRRLGCVVEDDSWTVLPAPDWPSDDVRAIVKTADEIALYFEALLWQPNALDWAPAVLPALHKITGGGERPRPSRADLIERFMPLIAPRPRECWRTEVERLLG